MYLKATSLIFNQLQKTKNMKVQDITANGISYHSPAKHVESVLITLISAYKMRFTENEILSSFPQDSNYHIGRRFSDNSAVATRILSALVTASMLELKLTKHDHDSDLLIEMHTLAFTNSLSASEWDVLINDGLMCCADADHWYTFEKEWD